MQITEQLFNNLASLAKLEFAPEERQQLMADLEKLLTWVEQLQQVDVEGVEPQRHMSEASNSSSPLDITARTTASSQPSAAR